MDKKGNRQNEEGGRFGFVRSQQVNEEGQEGYLRKSLAVEGELRGVGEEVEPTDEGILVVLEVGLLLLLEL